MQHFKMLNMVERQRIIACLFIDESNMRAYAIVYVAVWLRVYVNVR